MGLSIPGLGGLSIVNHRYLGESGRLGFGGAYIVLISGGRGYKYS